MKGNGIMGNTGIIELLEGKRDIDEKVMERGGTPYVMDSLEERLILERIDLIKTSQEAAIYRLTKRLDGVRNRLASRTESTILNGLSAGAITIYGNPYSVDDMRSYLRRLRTALVDDMDTLRHEDIVVVDNAYGNDYTQYYTYCKKGYGIDYHPTIFSIRMSPHITDDDVDVLVRALDRILSVDAVSVKFEFHIDNDTEEIKSPITYDEFHKLIDNGDYTVGTVKEYTDSVMIRTYDSTVAALFRFAGRIVPSVDDWENVEVTPVYHQWVYPRNNGGTTGRDNHLICRNERTGKLLVIV